jgi:hypothetical protein
MEINSVRLRSVPEVVYTILLQTVSVPRGSTAAMPLASRSWYRRRAVKVCTDAQLIGQQHTPSASGGIPLYQPHVNNPPEG